MDLKKIEILITPVIDLIWEVDIIENTEFLPTNMVVTCMDISCGGFGLVCGGSWKTPMCRPLG
ncbi:MAG: hypothetical protein FWE21_02810 [Defluviitaleaceae bacterium]|nr:hypothetical protein [Defluviitaleaceae bacterium]